MLLARLRVRQKLALLVLPLLVLVALGAVPLVGDRFAAAAGSTRTAETVQRAVRIGELVQVLQQERVLSLGYVEVGAGREELVGSAARVLDLTEQLAVDYGRTDDRLASVLRTIGDRTGIGGVRLQVLRRGVPGIGVYSVYTDAIRSLIDQVALDPSADLSTAAGRQEFALGAIVRHDEGTAAAASALFVAPDFMVTPRVVALVNAGMSSEDREERIFEPLADPGAVELYDTVEQGESRQSVEKYLSQIIRDPAAALGTSVPPSLLQSVESLIDLGRLVETRIATQDQNLATVSAQRDRLIAGLGVGLALVVLLGAIVLSVLISRSIARPLGRLTESADEVAKTAQAELVRVADTEDGEIAAPRLRPVRVGTSDELGELAEAFNRVQRVAADLVERQVVSRRNVATMFGNVGRRTQNLVGRQLAMIDSLERNEQDPALLERLYRLDHVSTRLRRNANSLVVLSGAADQELSGEPMSVVDAIRAALGEIEGFQRVRLLEAEPALLTPHITPDVVLLLAELLENGTSFSPPHTEVEVAAAVAPAGDVRIRIVDHGLGMTAEQLAEENARLVERERLDLAPTDVLGLFVVGRLSRRHGIRVTLLPTAGTGVTAEVVVPARHVLRTRGAPVPVTAAAPAPAPAAAAPAVRALRAAPGAPAPGAPTAPVGPGGPGGPGASAPVAPTAPVGPGGPGASAPVAPTAPVGPVGPVGPGGPGASAPGVPGVPGASAASAAPVAPAAPGAAGPAAPAAPVGPPADRGWWEPAANGPAPGIRRRVKGAQHPKTDPRTEAPGPPVPPAPEDARRAIEDFEEGVRRAQQETSGQPEPPRNGHVRPVEAAPLFLRPAPPEVTQAQVREFEEGVRRALARLDELSHSDGHTATFFARRTPTESPEAQDADVEPPRPADPPLRLVRPADDPDRAGPEDGLPAAWRRADAPPAPRDVVPPQHDAALDFFEPTPTPPEPTPPTEATPPEAAASPGATAYEPARPAATPAGPVASPGATAYEPARPAATPAGPAASGSTPAVATPPESVASSGASAYEPAAAAATSAGSAASGSIPAEAAPAGAAPPAAIPAEGAGGGDVGGRAGLPPLVRRVPGAQMPAGARAARPKPAPREPLDADAPDDSAAAAAEAARAMVELFESGVDRALNTESEPGRTTEEGGR